MEIQKLKSIIIDDSEIQRVALSKIVNKHPNLILEGSYRNGIQAKNMEADKNVDLIFLDIEMPLIDGFDLLDNLKGDSQVIVVSGKADYALKAFDYNVTDYILKPVNQHRFDIAVKKAIRNVQGAYDNQDKAHFFVKSNFRKVRINYCEIKWIEALGDYIKLFTETSNHTVLISMKAFEEQLPSEQFLRIHKSFIINLNKIENFTNIMVEIDGKKMPISRKRKTRFMSALSIE